MNLVIDTKYISKTNIDDGLFETLLDKTMYSETGMYGKVWSNPSWYIKSEAYLSLGYVGDDLATLLFLPKDQYFGYDRWVERLKETYGLIGFYTKPKYRNQGLASKLFKKFDDDYHIRKLSCSGRAKLILKHLPDREVEHV